MPIRKWIVQYFLMLGGLFVLFAAVQYLKGRGSDYAVEFGALWAFISASIFLLVRIRNYKRRIACALCNDLPEER